MLQDELFPEPRPRNPVWDALSELFGEPTTDTNKRLRGKVVASLRRAGAEYQEIMTRAMSWPLHFPGATLTETALEKHWDRLARPPLRADEDDVRRIERRIRMEALERDSD